eukprot:TRINITY_DN6056_c0_g1_i1.p1 TRINITY_DN6056_c0_g1~~TRINITY_DN6056_c0_g1_i1.p1  ORF type:complete len:214 (+),score=52.97 TRINITY_DN6056_c0_g1_i1:33-644(+)
MLREMYKVIILGDMGVGKTSVLSRYVDGKFTTKYKATIGADLLVKEVEVDGEVITLQLWDTAGQERFQTIGNAYYRGAEACGLMFDLTDSNSFSHLNSWRDEFNLQTQSDDKPFFLIGNKCDMPDNRQVTQKSAISWCAKESNNPEGKPIPYYETSALDSSNIDQVFYDIAVTLKKNRPPKDDVPIKGEVKLAVKPPGKRCKC